MKQIANDRRWSRFLRHGVVNTSIPVSWEVNPDRLSGFDCANALSLNWCGN
jgi:hypothetical protein